MRLSLVIPCLNKQDPKLLELLASIDKQDFPKDQMETLVITEGTSESAKAIGIRKAKGEVIGILASDNELVYKDFLSTQYSYACTYGASYPSKYYHSKNDDILNRYFSLIGGNDPLSFYMKKNDRCSYSGSYPNMLSGSIGDNGYFIQRKLIASTDLDNYYHIDNALEAKAGTIAVDSTIWHKTGGNIFSFFAKRYRYGLQHAFNKNRRWHLVDFKQPKDIVRLIWFILFGLTLVQPLYLSFRGWIKIRDVAWFLHPVVTLMTILNYSALMIHIGLRKLFQSLFAPTAGQRA